ncbi:hypothetical protein FS842_006375, partial [Serendipita sp. 407]
MGRIYIYICIRRRAYTVTTPLILHILDGNIASLIRIFTSLLSTQPRRFPSAPTVHCHSRSSTLDSSFSFSFGSFLFLSFFKQRKQSAPAALRLFFYHSLLSFISTLSWFRCGISGHRLAPKSIKDNLTDLQTRSSIWINDPLVFLVTKMFSTRLLALIVAATAASSVQGKTVSLVSRQLAPAIPGIPVPCQPVCVVFTALQQSITPQQLCTPANAANIQRCAQCIMTMNTSSVIGNGDLMTQLQTAVNSFTNACAAAQVPVPPITLVNPLTQQPLLGTGTLPTPGLPLPGAPGAAPLPPGAPG